MAVTFAVWGATAKLAWIYFSFFTISRMEDSFLTDLSNISIWVFSFLIRSRMFTVSLKEALYGFCVAYLNRQHHCSCALGPVLSKIRATWPPALWYWCSRSDNRKGYWVTNGQERLWGGDTGQKHDSHPGRNREWHKISSRYSKWWAM